MYHVRFKKSHYEAGYHWGQALKKAWNRNYKATYFCHK